MTFNKILHKIRVARPSVETKVPHCQALLASKSTYQKTGKGTGHITHITQKGTSLDQAVPWELFGGFAEKL